MTAGWRRWLRIFRRDPRTDVEAELRFHMEARIEDLMGQGLAPAAARTQAQAEFGDLDATRSQLEAIDRRVGGRRHRAEWWKGVAQDFRHTLRQLMRSPAFTLMVVGTLALGIGVNAAVFSLADRLFLATPPGVEQPHQVERVLMSVSFPGQPAARTMSVFNYPQFRRIAQSAPRGARVAGSVRDELPYGPGADAPTRSVEFAVGGYLRLLGLRPTIGRFFSDRELEVAALTPVAVISHRLWLRDFHGSSAVLGQPLELGTHRYTIIGVAPKGFAGAGIGQVDIWLPFNCWPSWVTRDPHWYDETGTLMIRPLVRMEASSLRPAVVAAATSGLRTGGQRWESQASAVLQPLRGAGQPEFFARQEAMTKRLAAVAVIILLVACANVTTLVLNRAMARRHETAIRLALGVSRARLLLHTLSESLVTSILAGGVATLAAVWGALALGRLVFPDVSWGEASLSPAMAWFVAALSVGVGIVVGLLPAVQGSSPNSLVALKRDVAHVGRSRGRVRSGLVIAQAALSLVLVAGAGLFVRSLQQVQAIDLGWDVHNIVFVTPSAGEDTAAARAMRLALPRLAERLAALPEVERTALMSMPPIWGLSWIDTYLPNRDSLPGAGTQGPPMVLLGSPGFLEALGVHLEEGRLFQSSDRSGSEPVLVVNRALARAYWPGEPAVGKCHILHQRSDPCRRIVGVVQDPHMQGLIETAAPAYFVPISQAPDGWTPRSIVVRTVAGRRAGVESALPAVVRDALGPAVRPGIQSMDALLAPQFRQWKAGAALFAIAGVLALLVAAVGIYSTIAFGLEQRTHEFGVRMALGARAGQVLRHIVGAGVRTVLVGVVAGVIATLLLGRLVSSLLYGVAPWDPWVLLSAAAVLLVVAAVASLPSAVRAARLDPVETLRAE